MPNNGPQSQDELQRDKPAGKPEPSQEQMFLDVFMKEIDRLDTRTDWFLIFHAILLEAYATAKDVNPLSQVLVGILGFVTATLWFFAGWRQRQIMLFQGMMMRKAAYAGHLAAPFRKFVDARKKRVWFEWAKPDRAFTVAIPALIAVLWLVLLIAYTPHDEAAKNDTPCLAFRVFTPILVVVACGLFSHCVLWATEDDEEGEEANEEPAKASSNQSSSTEPNE